MTETNLYHTDKFPTIAAHRGASRRYAENSLAAIKEAINIAMQYPGLPYFVEVDVRSTQDDHLVLMHDSHVDRTTYGRGRVEELPLLQVQSLPMKSLSNIVPESKQFPDREARPFLAIDDNADKRVPTLDEVMQLIHDANIEREKSGANAKPIGLAIEVKHSTPKRSFMAYLGNLVRNAVAGALDWIGFSNSAAAVISPQNIGKKIGRFLNNHPDPLPPIITFSSAGKVGKRDLHAMWHELNDEVRQQLSPSGKEINSPGVLVDVTIKNPLKRLKLEAIEHTKRFWAMGSSDVMPMITTAQPRDSLDNLVAAIQDGANFITTNYPGQAMEVLDGLNRGEVVMPSASAEMLQQDRGEGKFVEKVQQRSAGDLTISR